MPGRDYAVELHQDDRYLGAGFLLTRCYVLTADHCLRPLLPQDDRVDVRFGDGAVAEGRVRRRETGADLAVVELLQPQDIAFTLPVPDRARPGQRWRGLHRPQHNDPDLGGQVHTGAVPYRCEGGEHIEALQLTVEQALGDYSGYSGGPIQRDEAPAAVIGILIEQYPDRENGRRSANVLFAATMHEVVRRFPYFQTEHLARVLPGATGTDTAPDTARPPLADPPDGSQEPRTVMADGTRILTVLKEWADSGLIDPAQLVGLRTHVARTIVDLALEGESRP